MNKHHVSAYALSCALVTTLCFAAEAAGQAAPSPAQVSASSEAASDEALRAQRLKAHSSLVGPTGGFHVIDAHSGAVGSFRVMVGFSYFNAKDWLDDPNERRRSTGNTFSWSWTPTQRWELYAFAARWNNDTGPTLPRSFQVLGDLTVGAKWMYPLQSWLTGAVDAGVSVPLNTSADTGPVMRSFGLGPRASLSADLRQLETSARTIPLILRLNAGYWWNRQEQLVRDLEQSRYEELETSGPDARRPMSEEDRHLISRSERFALRLDRTNMAHVAFGVESPLELTARRTTISPMAEWRYELPLHRQGLLCPPSTSTASDPCSTVSGARSFRQSALIGARVLPPLRGLSLHAALELGLTGVRTHAYELHSQPPYTVFFGLGYVHDYQTQRALLKKVKESSGK